jgi:Coenzyme F390 synthetase
MIYNEKAECMSANEKEELQLKRLQKVVKRAYENVPYYRQRLEEAGVSPEDIQTLKDLENTIYN